MVELLVLVEIVMVGEGGTCFPEESNLIVGERGDVEYASFMRPSHFKGLGEVVNRIHVFIILISVTTELLYMKFDIFGFICFSENQNKKVLPKFAGLSHFCARAA